MTTVTKFYPDTLTLEYIIAERDTQKRWWDEEIEHGSANSLERAKECCARYSELTEMMRAKEATPLTTTKRECVNCGRKLRGHRHDYCIACGCHDTGFDISEAGPFARCHFKAAYQLSGQPMQGKHDPQVCEAHVPLNHNWAFNPHWATENGGQFTLLKTDDYHNNAWWIEYKSPGEQHIRHPFNGTVATASEARQLAEDWYAAR